jgi:D-alanyl-D-alanine carboxypeptidase
MQMNKFLNLFKKYQHLLPKKYNGLFKTGTLTGVYSVAGFYKNKNNQNFNISIILNQNKNNRNIILKKIKKFLDEL